MSGILMVMQIQHNIPLSQLTTMRLGGVAQIIVSVETADELLGAVQSCMESEQPFFILGSGSNVIARDEEFHGTIILNHITGFDIVDDDGESTTIKIGGGENWDEIVSRVVKRGLSGIEAMSAIPGSVGATPVQNVGAYGQEIADTLVELEALDTETMEFVTLANKDCGFTYRSSIFKDPTTRHHLISSITLKLLKTHLRSPFYTSLQNYLDNNGITDYSPLSIRRAVTAIRAHKLPDPSKIANTGSFFKNPIVSAKQADQLAESYPLMPQFPMPNQGMKLAAGWLIEQAGLKGYHAHGMKTYENNALVLVNQSANSYADLLKFRDEIIVSVHEKFGVRLEQEPETL